MAQSSDFTVRQEKGAEPVTITVQEPETLQEFVDLGLVTEDGAEGHVCNLAFQSWRINAQRAAREAMKAGQDPQSVVDDYTYPAVGRGGVRRAPASVSEEEIEELESQGISRDALQRLADAGKITLG